MALPQFKRVLFNQAPLKLVIAQVRVPIMARFGEAGFIAPFEQALRAAYPKRSRDHQVTYTMSFKGVESGAGEVLWRFATRDGRWTVVVGEGAITLEVRGYSSVEELVQRFERILGAASEYLDVSERTRLGLRYINEIRFPGADTLKEWTALLQPELVGFAGSELLDGRIEHMLQELRVQRADGMLTIRHGLLRGAVVDPAPPEADARFYLLDMDYYDSAEVELNVDEITDRLRGYNDTLYRFFRWTLTEQLYEHLEPTHAE